MFQYTGNPFVDAGIYAICEWVKKSRPEELDKKDLKRIAKEIVPLYLTDRWNSSVLHGNILPNHGKIANPSLQKYSIEERRDKALSYFNELIDHIEPLHISGDCISCGRRDVRKRITRSEVPLTGSKSLINFFSFGVDGADYCPACTFAIQFFPLVCYTCRDAISRRRLYLLLLHSNSEKVLKYWTREAIRNVKGQFLTKNFSGCFNEGYKNPKNALFHIVQNILLEYDARWQEERVSLNFYHFTNHNQFPDLEIYHLPSQVFRFLAYIKLDEKHSDWMKIVRKGYSKVKWDEVKDESDYKNKINKVYSELLEGKSITRYFFNTKERTVYGDWDLLSRYLMEVRNMSEKRLEILKRVGDEISEFIKSSEKITRLRQLENAKKYYEFRNILRFIEKERIKSGSKGALFTLEEYIEDLFPDSNLGWKETQDLLLFRIYENLHDWLVEKRQLAEELTTEEVEMEV